MSKKDKKDKRNAPPCAHGLLPPLTPKPAPAPTQPPTPPTPKDTPAEPPRPKIEDLTREQLIDKLRIAVGELVRRERIVKDQAAQINALSGNVNRLLNANLVLTEALSDARAATQAARAAAQQPPRPTEPAS